MSTGHHEMPFAPMIAAVGTALPPHYATQEETCAGLRRLWAGKGDALALVERVQRSIEVRGRHLAMPVEAYHAASTFAEQNRRWNACALELGERACRAALERAGLLPEDIDQIVFVSVTGISAPSLDARLVNRLGFRRDVKRTPIFGLGCVAGVAGVARVTDTLRAFPAHTSLLLSVELCSLTLQRDDTSAANVIAAQLFADGAAAVVARGAQAARKSGRAGGAAVLATHAVFYPDTEHIMGWDVVDSGFRVVLSAGVPALVREHVRRDVDAFLARHGLSRRDVRHWIVHTGGPKVLEAVAETLELPGDALDRSWRSLREIGNVSSASVLFVLRDFLDEPCARPGDHGVMMAFGPGFCSEMALLRW
ncbi:chalcone synthase [Sorangium cellulosum]|uniref:Chalcone synthase n=1 Tax=Sorangium cellulosum TaxID=56 RepID=A0A3Q8I2L3_SORCE|nr:3-oxoacyl-[acyl-carrier-protein] synthase III C-terminal domain-containing protein [Sorangium cellulosum]AUX21439.1 chalcone synthase [Sorangium cellulosum]AYM53052.1 chalcone synthase [Sorangium cellulosum]